MTRYRVTPPEGVVRTIEADNVTAERDALVFTRRGSGLIAQFPIASDVEMIEESDDDR